jgi:hypothetical protein
MRGFGFGFRVSSFGFRLRIAALYPHLVRVLPIPKGL